MSINRPPMNVTYLKGQPNNPLEKILMRQLGIMAAIIEQSQSAKNDLTEFQNLCKSIYSNSCHTIISTLILIVNLRLPGSITSETVLTIPTDMLRPIAGLIRPIFEAITIMKVINHYSTELGMGDSDEISRCRNEIAKFVYALHLYDAEYQFKWQTIFNKPIRKRDELKSDAFAKMYQKIDEDRKKITEELNSLKIDRAILKRERDLSPKDVLDLIIDVFQKKGVIINSPKEAREVAWRDRFDDIYKEIVRNLKDERLDNPWQGDPNEYENLVSPGIAFKRLIHEYSSRAIHLDAKYLFQDVPSKINNIYNLWCIVTLALPRLLNDFIEIESKVLGVKDSASLSTYDYGSLSMEVAIWAKPFSPLLIKKIMQGY